MYKKIPFIDISGKNCWIINLLPFSKEERKDFNLISNYENDCIEKKIFGTLL